MSNAKTGPGFFIQKGDGASPENFTTVAEVLDVKLNGQKLDMAEVTNQSSPGGWKEFKPSVKDPGSLEFDLNFQASEPTHGASVGLVADFINAQVRNWRVTLQDVPFWRFAGYVMEIPQNMPVNGALKGNFKIQITGAPVLA